MKIKYDLEPTDSAEVLRVQNLIDVYRHTSECLQGGDRMAVFIYILADLITYAQSKGWPMEGALLFARDELKIRETGEIPDIWHF